MKNVLKVIGVVLVSACVLFATVLTSTVTTTYLISQFQPKDSIITCSVEPKPTYEYMKAATVYIHGSGTGEKTGIMFMLTGQTGTEVQEWSGTGVIVKVDKDYTYVLTNNHVAGNDFKRVKIYIQEENNVRTQVEIIKNHPKYDMALLRVAKIYPDKVAVKGFNTVVPQDKVYMVGHYLGIPYIYSEGNMAGYEKDEEDGILLQLPGCYGNSGSGVLNKDGELVALVYAIHGVSLFGVDTAKTMAVDGKNVIAFLTEQKIIE